jgi:hypothetical protein
MRIANEIFSQSKFYSIPRCDLQYFFSKLYVTFMTPVTLHGLRRCISPPTIPSFFFRLKIFFSDSSHFFGPTHDFGFKHWQKDFPKSIFHVWIVIIYFHRNRFTKWAETWQDFISEVDTSVTIFFFSINSSRAIFAAYPAIAFFIQISTSIRVSPIFQCQYFFKEWNRFINRMFTTKTWKNTVRVEFKESVILLSSEITDEVS